MDPVTLDQRKRELRLLLAQQQQRPAHDWSREQQRIEVLQAMINGAEFRTKH